jgi:glutaredoxin
MVEKRRVLLRIEGCPYCVRAEEALDESGVIYERFEVPRDDRSLVTLLSGQPTVPVLVEIIGSKDQDDEIVAYCKELGREAGNS